MIDTRTCCAGNLPEEILNLQNENHQLKQLNKFLIITISAGILLAIGIVIIKFHNDINQEP